MGDSIDNTYIFIIWSKVSWCKKRIISDLKVSFEIRKIINLTWDKNLFEDNLAAFYGSKIADYKEKIKRIGSDGFTLVVVRDLKPVYEQKFIYNQYEKVNINVYNKKKTYREWTGTNFRIHSSDNETETKHDLCVLFGPNFNNLIANGKEEETLILNTFRFNKINNLEELGAALYYFGNNVFVEKDTYLFIFSKNKTNVIRFLNVTQIGKCKYSIEIKNEKRTLYIFGEEEGDIPEEFIEKATNKNTINELLEIFDKYILYLCDRTNMDRSIINYLNNNNFNVNYSERSSVREDENVNIIYKVKKNIKYILARINNIIYSIKEKYEK